MKRTLAYFITPHGFGHAARAAAVMQAAQAHDPEIHFRIYSTTPDWFFRQSRIQYTQVSVHTDVGIIQHTPFHEDFDTTLSALSELIPYSPKLLSRLTDDFARHQVSAVFCDIAPLGIAAAQQAAIPSILIENFTWDWIYEAYLNDYAKFSPYIVEFERLFSLADFHIQTNPLCRVFPRADRCVNPISRCSFHPPAEIRRQLGITESQKLLTFSMGGFKDDSPFLHHLHQFSNVHFLIPGDFPEIHRDKNLIFLPNHDVFYHPDLISGSDFIIGKSGYSTIAEVWKSGIPFAFISRARFREAPPLASFIKASLPSIEINESTYLSGEWIDLLPEFLTYQKIQPNTDNGAQQIIQFLKERGLI